MVMGGGEGGVGGRCVRVVSGVVQHYYYTAPPRGNIPDGIKGLTLQTVNIPTRGSQQFSGVEGWIQVHGGVGNLIGDLSIHFTQCHRSCKKKKAKGSEREERDDRT